MVYVSSGFQSVGEDQRGISGNHTSCTVVAKKSLVTRPSLASRVEHGATKGTPTVRETAFAAQVSRLLSSTITLDCNMKLVRCGSLLPSVLATEAYQLPFDPSGSSIFGTSLQALSERAGEVAIQRQQQSLEEALVKTAKGAKSQ